MVVLGLSSVGPAPAGQVTLLFWPGPESEAMQKAIDAYNIGPGKSDAVSVKQLLFSRQGYFEKELADMAARSSQFDLALVTTYTLGKYAPYLNPVDQFVSKDLAAKFFPVALQSLTINGKLFGVPTDISLHFTYYRKDLVDRLLKDDLWRKKYAEIAQEKLGKPLEPRDPGDWTWDDYEATALFFTRSINPNSPTRYGTVLQLKNLIFNIMIWQSTMVSNGGDWMTADHKITIDSDAAKIGLQLYKRLIDARATPPGSISYEFAEANAAFGSGQAATMLQWNAAFNELNDPKKTPLVAGKIGLAPLPAGSAGHKTHVHSLGIGLNAASKNQQDAGKFLSWLATEDAMKIYAQNGGTPPMSSILEQLSGERPEFALISDHATRYGYVVTGGTEAFAVPIYEVLAEKFSGFWAGQSDASTALREAAAGMADRIKQ